MDNSLKEDKKILRKDAFKELSMIIFAILVVSLIIYGVIKILSFIGFFGCVVLGVIVVFSVISFFNSCRFG